MSRFEGGRLVGASHVLIAGVSARAAAESAARAGFEVTSLDAFGDLDHHPAVRCLSMPRDFGALPGAAAAARAARTIACDAVVYLSNLDNHPRTVAALAGGRALWGNPPAVLRRVRDPRQLAEALRRRGLAAPGVYVAPDVGVPSDPPDLADPDAGAVAVADVRSAGGGRTVRDPGRSVGADPGPAVGHWLVKPFASGGGHGVRRWREGTAVPRGCYRQQLVNGTPGSVVFVAAAGQAVPIGMSRQLVGERVFGAAGYRYCGSIVAPAGDAQFARDAAVFQAACALAHAASEEFGLVGVNGIDFVACDGVPWAIEVNPRWSASMELVERAYGLSVFAAHAGACRSGTLPSFDLDRARRGARASGKAVVFARREVELGDTRAWLSDATVRDVPHPGERIRAGRPICTVFADGADAAECHAALIRRADRVYTDLDRSTPSSRHRVGLRSR